MPRTRQFSAHVAAPFAILTLVSLLPARLPGTVAAAAAGAEPAAEAGEPTGAAIYREHCARCHGADGGGTAAVPAP